MSASETSQFVRLRVDMVLEITDLAALSGTALESIAAEYGEYAEPDGEAAEERTRAEAAVRTDGAEALASLVDPFVLVGEVPGVRLTRASWSSESVDHDPDDPDHWDLDDEDEEDEEYEYGEHGGYEEYGDGDREADRAEGTAVGDGRGVGVPHNG